MKPNETPKVTATLPEFAAAWGISRTSAYELARTNSLPVPVIRLGRRLVVSRVALDRVLAERSPQPGASSADR